jgi:hypothetical protein
VQNLSPEGRRILNDVARRHGVSVEAAVAVLDALVQGNGRQAQFNHQDLGGMGQWSQGGMIMVGDMFNQGLKHRVDMLCNEIAGLLQHQPLFAAPAGSFQSQSQSGVSLFASRSAGQWWPAALGNPASVGNQNDLRYAYFPSARRLAILQGGQVSVYDTGEHQIFGFSQQQGSDRSLTFTSQLGVVRVADLALVSSPGGLQTDPPAGPARGTGSGTEAMASAPTPRTPSPAAEEILKLIERLAELRQKDILTEEEFSAKKTELLSRL